MPVADKLENRAIRTVVANPNNPSELEERFELWAPTWKRVRRKLLRATVLDRKIEIATDDGIIRGVPDQVLVQDEEGGLAIYTPKAFAALFTVAGEAVPPGFDSVSFTPPAAPNGSGS